MDHYEAGKPLTPQGLFQLMTDEVMRDGAVENWEKSTLMELARYLALPRDEAQSIFELSRRKFAAGKLGEMRSMEPLLLCETVLTYIFSDRKYSQEEEELFNGLRTIFKVTDAEYLRLMQKAFPRPGRT